MTAQSLPQPAATFIPTPRYYLGDDATITARLDTDPQHPVDVFIRDGAHAVTSLHLSPTTAKQLYHHLGDVLMALNVATITAAGFEDEDVTAARLAAPEFPVAHSFGEAVVVSDYDADLAIVRSFSAPGVTS